MSTTTQEDLRAQLWSQLDPQDKDDRDLMARIVALDRDGKSGPYLIVDNTIPKVANHVHETPQR